MNAKLILNPAAGRGRGARRRRLLRRLADHHGVALLEPEGPGEVRLAARRAAEEGCERLLVAGGDGTYHQAAQGLARSSCALVPIALGTGNDLARELGLPLDAAVAIPMGLEAPLAPMDLGRIDETYFCGIAGSGIDSETAELSLSIRRLRGPLVYVWAVLHVLARFRPPHLVLEVDGERQEGRVMLTALANTRFFGGGMQIAPSADRSDGLLDVVRIDTVSRLEFLSIFPRVYRGTHVGHPFCSVVKARAARIAFDRPMACWGDGERLAPVPPEGLLVEVAPGALLVPKLPLPLSRRRDRNAQIPEGEKS